jgi:hypothetical protein
LEFLKSAQRFLVPDFSNFLHNSYGPEKLTEVATFNPLHSQKSAKILDMFKGAKTFAKLLLFFLTDSVFYCFES